MKRHIICTQGDGIKKKRYTERMEAAEAMRQQRLQVNRRHVVDRSLAGNTAEREQIYSTA